MKRTLFAVLLMLGAGAVHAQAPSPAEGGRRRPGEEAARMVDAYVISNLQESLGITDEQFAKLVPLVKKLQTERREAMRARMRTVRELRSLLESGSATEAQVVERLTLLKSLETEEPQKVRQTVEAIDDELSPLQQAKFRVLEADVGLKVRELMTQMRDERRRTPGGQGRPGPREAPRSHATPANPPR